jgi:hypothetical protein
MPGHLQRLSRRPGAPGQARPQLARAWLAASGFDTTHVIGTSDYTGSTFFGEVCANQLMNDDAAVTGGVSPQRLAHRAGMAIPTSSAWLPRASIGLGLRKRNTRFDASHWYAPIIQDGTYDGRGLGRVDLGLETV